METKRKIETRQIFNVGCINCSVIEGKMTVINDIVVLCLVCYEKYMSDEETKEVNYYKFLKKVLGK